MIAHRVYSVRGFAARTGDTCIVEEDYGTALRKPVRHKRIPIVQAAAEVLKEDERRSAFRAEAPVRVPDSISLDEAGWSRDVSVFRHIYLLGYRSECHVCNYGIQAQRTRLYNSEVEAGPRVESEGSIRPDAGPIRAREWKNSAR